jgi:hypothetical protein
MDDPDRASPIGYLNSGFMNNSKHGKFHSYGKIPIMFELRVSKGFVSVRKVILLDGKSPRERTRKA